MFSVFINFFIGSVLLLAVAPDSFVGLLFQILVPITSALGVFIFYAIVRTWDPIFKIGPEFYFKTLKGISSSPEAFESILNSTKAMYDFTNKVMSYSNTTLFLMAASNVYLLYAFWSLGWHVAFWIILVSEIINYNSMLWLRKNHEKVEETFSVATEYKTKLQEEN